MTARFSAPSASGRRALWRPKALRAKKAPAWDNPRFRIAKRPPAPAFWTNIAPRLRARSDRCGPDRHRYWLLVLQAKRFRYRFFERAPASLYVPPVAAKAAAHEILAFERERPAPPLPQPPERRGLYWYAALLAMLVPWHAVRWDGLLSLSSLPGTARDWLTVAGLDAYRVSVTGEWWRALTSLTLHADAAHLISNLVMGTIFGIPLCRHTGVGFGFFLTILAGAIGNMATAFLRPASFLSQGFSTAVFASVGLLTAFAAVFAARHAAYSATEGSRKQAIRQGVLKGLVPFGAGLGFLAMLGGSEAPNVDYLAHTMGLVAGILLGFCTAFSTHGPLFLRGTKNAALQACSLAAAVFLLAMAWRLALT